MIILDFDSRRLWEYREDPNLSRADYIAIGVTGFVLPIKFIVNDVDLFAVPMKQTKRADSTGHEDLDSLPKTPPNTWLSMPLLNFAINGLEIVRKVCKGETITYYLPDIGSYLHFKPDRKSVAIYSHLNMSTAFVECTDLLNAFEEFVTRVRNILNQEVPQLKEFPYWKTWLEANSSS